RSLEVFEQTVHDLQSLYGITATAIICDAHPGYATSRWAQQCGLPVTKVFHHHAHASSLALEYPDVKNWLVFSWDGVGLGADGSLWGGETFLGCPGNWQRVASFKTFRLPGGEKTSRQAWRVAASLCWHSAIDTDFENNHSSLEQLKTIWQKNINCPESSAAGRLFSAAASLLGLLDEESFEGHGPMLLETLAETGQADGLSLPIIEDEKGVLRIDWQPLVKMLKDKTLKTAYRARCFHETLAECVSRLSLQYCEENKDLVIGLSGGVFQNQLLLRLIKQRMQQHKLDLKVPASVPVNDGGLSAGQIIEYYYQ
ncbi:MAG: carbamoyltransferase HypF, partial [Gammaproteobacteria bacterium]|nr:carbamoyltransferase HypF [Gammaproteobacteria bacterium]